MKTRILKLTGICTSVLLLGFLYLLLFKHTGLALDCVFQRITGFYCPGCGISRMLLALSELDFYRAFRYNPGVAVISPLLMFYIITRTVYYVRGLPYTVSKRESRLWILLMILIMLYGIIRNLPGFEFLTPAALPL